MTYEWEGFLSFPLKCAIIVHKLPNVKCSNDTIVTSLPLLTVVNLACLNFVCFSVSEQK